MYLKKCWLAKISQNCYRVIAWTSVQSVKMSLKILFPQVFPFIPLIPKPLLKGSIPAEEEDHIAWPQGHNRSEGGDSGGREISHPKSP